MPGEEKELSDGSKNNFPESHEVLSATALDREDWFYKDENHREHDYQKQGFEFPRKIEYTLIQLSEWYPEKGYGFFQLPPSKENLRGENLRGARVFVHVSAIPGKNKTRGADYRNQKFLIEPGKIVEEEKDGRKRLKVTLLTDESEIKHEDGKQGYYEKLGKIRADFEEKLPEVFEEIKKRLPILERGVEINGLEVEVVRGSLKSSEFDPILGATVHETQSIRIRNKNRSIGLTKDFEMKTKGWHTVRLAEAHYHTPIPENHSLKVEFKFNGGNAEIEYPAEGSVPFIKDGRIIQEISAQTPKGIAKTEIIVYEGKATNYTSAKKSEVWGNYDIEELKLLLEESSLKELGYDKATFEWLRDVDTGDYKSPGEVIKAINRTIGEKEHRVGLEDLIRLLRMSSNLFDPNSTMVLKTYKESNFVGTEESNDGRIDKIYQDFHYLSLHLKSLTDEESGDYMIFSLDKNEKYIIDEQEVDINDLQTMLTEGFYRDAEARKILAKMLKKEIISRLRIYKGQKDNLNYFDRLIFQRQTDLLNKYVELKRATENTGNESKSLIDGKEKMISEITQSKEEARQLLVLGQKFEGTQEYQDYFRPLKSLLDLKEISNTSTEDDFFYTVKTFGQFRANVYYLYGSSKEPLSLSEAIRNARLALSKWTEEESVGARVNYKLTPERNSGSSVSTYALFKANGESQKPDRFRTGYKGESNTQIYDIVLPGTAEVKVNIHDPSGSLSKDPSVDLFVKIDINSEQITKEQLNAILDYFFPLPKEGSEDQNAHWLSGLGLKKIETIRKRIIFNVEKFNKLGNNRFEYTLSKKKSEDKPREKTNFYKQML